MRKSAVKLVYKVVCVIMAVFTLLSIVLLVSTFTSDVSSGFLDLTNVARYLLGGIAFVCGIVSLIAAKKGFGA